MEKKTAVGSALHRRDSFLWAFSVLLMVSGVGVVHGESPVTPRPGEALMNCSLNEDVRETKKSIAIKHDADVVFGCAWLARDPDKPDCRSSNNFTLSSFGGNYVLVRVPRTLQNSSYQCQLVPPDKDHPFTTCLVSNSDDAEDPPTAISAVTPSTAADQPQPRDRTGEESSGANGDDPGGLVSAVVALSFTVLLLLLMVIVMAVLYERLRSHRHRIRETPGDRRYPLLRNDKEPVSGGTC